MLLSNEAISHPRIFQTSPSQSHCGPTGTSKSREKSLRIEEPKAKATKFHTRTQTTLVPKIRLMRAIASTARLAYPDEELWDQTATRTFRDTKIHQCTGSKAEQRGFTHQCSIRASTVRLLVILTSSTSVECPLTSVSWWSRTCAV